MDCIRYNYADMRQKTEQLATLVAEFYCSYRTIASNIEWEGPARQKFDVAVEKALTDFVGVMNEVSMMPKNTADNMEQTDAELAARVREQFPSLF